MRDPRVAALRIVVLVLGLTVHEWGHAAMAYMRGDETAARQGRLTLDPLAHLDVMGSLAILLFGFGWAKPVPVDSRNLRNPRWDYTLVAAAGPATNFLQMLVFGLVLRFFGPIAMAVQAAGGGAEVLTLVKTFCVIGFQLNLMLAVFNLLPIGPLDGAQILRHRLPLNSAIQFAQFNQRYGVLLLMGVMVTGVLRFVATPVLEVMWFLVVGSGGGLASWVLPWG